MVCNHRHPCVYHRDVVKIKSRRTILNCVECRINTLSCDDPFCCDTADDHEQNYMELDENLYEELNPSGIPWRDENFIEGYEDCPGYEK